MKRRPFLGYLAFCSPPFIAECIRGSTVKWSPVLDGALEILRARDIPAHIPLTGTFSRFGWSHPGPIVFFFLAIPSRFGVNPAAFVAFWTLAWKWILVASIGALVSRRLGIAGGTMIASAFTLATMNTYETVWSYWNPTFAAIAVGSTLAIASFTWHSDFSLMVASLLASAAAQLHIGTAIPVVCVVVATVCARLIDQRRGGPPIDRRILGIGVAVQFLLWLPSLVDQFFVSGNLGKIVKYQFDSTMEPLGVRAAAEISAHHLIPFAPWSGFRMNSGIDTPHMGIAALLIPLAACALIACVARTDRLMRVPAVLFPVAIVASILVISRTTGEPWSYLFGWMSFVSALLWSTLFIAVVRAVSMRAILFEKLARGVSLALASLLVIASVPLTIARPIDLKRSMDAVNALTPSALSVVPKGESVTFLQTDFLHGVGSGIALSYITHGREVRINRNSIVRQEQLEASWGRHRLLDWSPLPVVAVVPGPLVPSYFKAGFVIRAFYDMDGRVTTIDPNVGAGNQVVCLMVHS